MPTPAPVLFGHHFASIAGLGPLLGPAIAVIWGWLPALLWIVIGSIFVGAVHDMGCLVASARNRARSIADVTADVRGHRARTLFLLFAIFALSLAMGVFVVNISVLFSPGSGAAEGGHVPQAVLPSVIQQPLVATAIAVGFIGGFALMRSPDPVTGQLKPLESILWQLFGASNQLLAGLSLLVVSLYCARWDAPCCIPHADGIHADSDGQRVGMEHGWFLEAGQLAPFGDSRGHPGADVVAGQRGGRYPTSAPACLRSRKDWRLQGMI